MKPRIQPIYVVPDVRTNYISIQFPEWFENARENHQDSLFAQGVSKRSWKVKFNTVPILMIFCS